MTGHILVALAATMLITSPAVAQSNAHQGMDHSQMSGMNHKMQNTAANPYAQAEMRMHEKMMAAQGSDASETFVRKMIEHHRGGVEMSRIAVDQAKDKEARDKAQKTMAMQQKEIAELQDWLKRHGKRPQ